MKRHADEIFEYERHASELKSQLATCFKTTSRLEQEIAAHVVEKSLLQSEALKDKELVMKGQTEVS